MGIPIKPCPKCGTNEWTPFPPLICKECGSPLPSSFIKKEKKKRKIALDIVPPPLSELVAFRKRIAKTYGEAEAKAFDKRMDDVILREMIIEHNRNDQ